MSGILISKCCGAVASEADTEDDSVKFWCGACRRMCKVTTPARDEGRPRTQQQAYEDQFDKDGKLKEENFDWTKVPQDAPRRPSDAPRTVETPKDDLEVKDGLIYQNGKVIGKALTDAEWYQGEFGEEWKGSDKALKALRNR